jgi:aflatoxin B1 aldehyde reductase
MKVILGTMNIEYNWSSSKSTITDYKSIISYYLQWSKLNSSKPILDTAYYYGNTKTEQVLGKIIPELLSKPIVATKANPWYLNDFTNNKFGQLSKYDLTRQLETSICNLGVDKVDVFYLHCWDWETPIRETLETATDLWRKEKFDKFGISNFNIDQTNLVLEIIESEGLCPLSYYQGMYNMVARKIEELIPILNFNKVEFWAYNPLAGGLLTGKYSNILNIQQLNDKTNGNSRFKSNKIYQNIFWKEPILNGIKNFVLTQNSTQYAFNWYELDSKLSNEDGIIIGSSSLEQIQNNLACFDKSIQSKLNPTIYSDFNLKYKDFESDTPNYYY